jgi:uncharacterized protein (TIGR02996 family)
MNDEAAFLTRIRKTPDDVAPRLVYADWLDERDDPRGELIRITEEMRTLPGYSERYWALKPRYKKLKANAAYEWRTFMGYNQKRLALQHGFPEDVPSRWRLIRECVERWFDIDMPDIGGHTVLVGDFQRSFGRRLPFSLREYISFCEDIKEGFPELEWYFGQLHPVRLSDPDETVPAFYDGRVDHCVVVRRDDCHHDDPPVYWVDWIETDFSDGEFASATVSEHVFDCVVQHIRSDIGGFDGDLHTQHQAIRAWLATFPNQIQLGHRRYFECADYLVRLEEHAGAATPTTIDVQLLSDLPADAVPACVWDLAHELPTGHGLFNPWNRWQ